MWKEEDYISNPAKCSCKIGKYLESFIDDSVGACGEIIEETKIIWTNFNEKEKLIKQKISYFTCILIIYYSIATSC